LPRHRGCIFAHWASVKTNRSIQSLNHALANMRIPESQQTLVDNEHRKGHFPDIWDPNKPQKPCLLSPNGGSTSPAVASTARPLPDVRTISGLQQALKMLGYRIAVDGDYGPETRQVVTNFQMHAGIVADGIAGAQTEAKLLSELSSVRQTDTHRANPV
jgi:murein L,D-transpeptidase YcbB/YkuD